MAKTGFSGRVVFSTRSGAILTLTQRVWQLIENYRFEELASKTRQQLIESEILVPNDEDELAVVIQQNARAIQEYNVLYQVVQPSAWCQLDCSYCGQQHTKQRLTEEHQQEFLQRLRGRLASGSYQHLKIGWFGGEPLAGMSVIRSLGARTQALAQEFGCTYSARIITNGFTLTPTLARELVQKHLVQEAEVTLDGLAQHHDRLRFTKARKGSFQRIFSNLVEVASTTEMRVVVRCNVNRSNSEGVAPLIERLAEEGLAPLISFYTSPVYAWGNDAHETALSKEEYASLELQWLLLQLRLGFKIGLIPPRRQIVCMSVQRDAEVLDAYGSMYNCTEVPYVPAYGQPNAYEIRIPITGIRSMVSDAPPKRLHNFNEQILQGEHRECAKCAMLPVCGGHCPKAWHEQHEPCPSAKINMRDRLNVLFALGQELK